MKRTAVLSLLATLSSGYCQSGNENGQESNMGSVKLSDLDHTARDCDAKFVQEFLEQIAHVKPSDTYELTVETYSCGALGYARKVGAWIDWNQNGDFTDDMAVGVTDIASDSPDVILSTFSITVPAEAKLGATRMRVTTEETMWNSNPFGPCGTFTWGATKDFTVDVSNDAPAPIPIPTPGTGGGSGMSGGSLFLLLAFVGLVLYCGLGCVYNIKYKGLSGSEAMPQRDLWCAFPSLVVDGCSFTKQKISNLFGGGGGGGDNYAQNSYSDL